MINLFEESVRTAVKQILEEQTIMNWSDTVFREHPKYYGDVDFSNESVIIGDNGLVSSKKYLFFRTSRTDIGILSTDFTTNISERLASGRKAEYGSKVYSTTSFDSINIENTVNVLHASPYNDNFLFCGDSSGTLSLFDINDNQKCLLTMNDFSPSINSMASHPSTGDILAIGGHGNISLIDLQQNKALSTAQIMDGEADIVNMGYSLTGNYLQCITANQYLFIYDPRSAADIDNLIKLRYAATDVVSVTDAQIAVCGLTSYLEPVLYAYDVRNALTADSIEANYIFKQNYQHKQCKPMMKYDIITKLLYVSFASCADVLVLNSSRNFRKEALYHSVADTFMAFDILPKHACKKREVNKIIKFGKDRIQLIVHTRGGKLIYDKLANTAKSSMLSAEQYFTGNANVGYEYKSKCVAHDFEEEKKRSVSLYLHITAKEALSNFDKYFDLKLSKTINCNLSLNIKVNAKYALFPSPTYGGGALGIISLAKAGRKKQGQLSAHAEKITTFDLGRNAYNEHLVITGAGDCKAIIHEISAENLNVTQKLHTLQCFGKVTFVGFHPRIRDVCVIAANKEHGNDEANVHFYNYNTGKVILDIKLANTKNVCDIQFERVIGLLAAVSSSGGNIKLMNIQSGEILQQFKCNTFMRDTKLFWASDKGGNDAKWYNKLICLGFGKASVRKFSLYDVSPVVDAFYNNYNVVVNEAKEDDFDGGGGGDNKQQDGASEEDEKAEEDEKCEEELQPLCSHSFGVSNAIPVGYYDGNDDLIYISSIGDRKIRVYEFSKKGISEMNMSHQSQTDIQGMDFGLKQFVNVKKVELSKCYKLTKDGVISPLSFCMPRKRMEYFQDDLYSNVLDVYNEKVLLDLDGGGDNGVDLKYVSLRPDDMELLSEAPEEELTTHQKRRNSQIALMEAAKLKEQPQSTEQAFDQFSRMVADAPTMNRWDAQNIGTEVAEDEWSD